MGGPSSAPPPPSTKTQKVMRTPPGIYVLHKICNSHFSFSTYQYSVLALTFLAYACYHAARKPASIVKSVLHPDNMNSILDNSTGSSNASHSFYAASNSSAVPLHQTGLSGGWAPFNGKLGKGLLGEMDIAFLSCYAFGMYFAGHLADRIDLRLFLTFGMIGSGVAVGLFGMAQFWNIHNLGYFILVQMVGGFLQSSGWPSVVSVVASWYGKKRRGLILGIWNAHTSVGNIGGSLLSSFALRWGWGWAFLVPGFCIASAGVAVYLFLVPNPEIIGFNLEEELGERSEAINGFQAAPMVENGERREGAEEGVGEGEVEGEGDGLMLLGARKEKQEENVDEKVEAIGFLEAWRIPGVAAFALCLFFAKLVAYTFLDWLPFYIGHERIGGVYLSSTTAGIFSTVYDVGGVFGGILAGYLSDAYQAQATVSVCFMALAIPLLGVYFLFGHVSILLNVTLLSLVGLLVNGPYALITCAVSADLGQHSSLRGNSRALATVTAIIDGTGSAGAALGPFLTGIISDVGGDKGWAAVFGMLMMSCLASVLCLLRLVMSETVQRWREARRGAAGEEDVERHLTGSSSTSQVDGNKV